MESLPKIVVERFGHKTAVGPHPDPDQLNALMENALGKMEQTRVLEHLSTCVACLEVVYLALPSFESEQKSLNHSTRPAWLSWPVLRWGAIAACGLVVGAAVTLHYESPSREAEQTAAVNSGSDAGPALERNSVSPKPNPITSENIQSAPASTSALAKTVAGARNNPMQAVASPSPAEAATDTKTSKRLSSIGANAVRDSSAPVLKDEAIEPGRKPDTELGNRRNEVAQSRVAGASVDLTEPATGKAKAPFAASADEAKLAASAPASRVDRGPTAVMGGLVLTPRWTLSADGVLQRSFDAGKTWQAISVSPDAKLRAVAAVGNEIWVGGEAGVLYHSSDAGSRWMRVIPLVEGNSLVAEIIGIEFTDTQHGKLATVGGVTWTTSDGGQSWSAK